MGRVDLEYLLTRAVEPSHVAADGQVFPRGQKGMVTVLQLNAAGDAATAEFRDGGAAGTIIWTLSAATGTSRPVSFPRGLYFSDGLYVTMTGTGPTVDAAGVSDSQE